MPNSVFEYTSKSSNLNYIDDQEISVEDLLDENGCINNTIYFNTNAELAQSINEIFQLGYELISFPTEINKGDFRFPDQGRDEEAFPYEQEWSFCVHVVIQWTLFEAHN